MQSKKPSAMDNDADFNIKDVKKILFPQMDASNNSNKAEAEIDNVDTRTAAASISKKKWCC